MTALTANRVFLALTAAVFALFGMWGLIDPEAMVKSFGINLTTGEARTLIRASYGGFLIGSAALFAVAAARRDWQKFGTMAVILLTLPIFLARVVGVAVDGGNIGLHLFYLLIEAGGIMLAGYFWLRNR